MAEPRINRRIFPLGLHQMLRTTGKAEAVVILHDRSNLLREAWIEITRRPAHKKLAHIISFIALRITGHLEEELHPDLTRLDVPDIEHPELVCAILEGFVHLLPDQCRGRGVKPRVRGRRAVEPLNVIIDARTA